MVKSPGYNSGTTLLRRVSGLPEIELTVPYFRIGLMDVGLITTRGAIALSLDTLEAVKFINGFC